MKRIDRSAFAAFLLLYAAAPAYAEDPGKQAGGEIEEVVVRAHPLGADGLAQPNAVLDAEKLQRLVASSIGESLIHLPGVHSSSFGQAVGRPVIRGLGGPRVKTTEDRIDSLDVSVSSPDHLVTVEPFTADSIEVLKGPSTLLYGTGAIGGVVNVHTGRIPQSVPESTEAKIDLRGADNAERRSSAGRLDVGLGNTVLHFDGFYRDADEYEIPGFAESSRLRALEEAEHEEEEGHDEEEHEEEEEAFGELPGSEMEVKGGSFGISHIGDRGFIGIAVSAYEADYGLPGGHGHHEEEEEHEGEEEEEEHGEEGSPVLGLEQTRVDLEAGLEQPFRGIESVNFRVGFNDYEHTEVEGSGEIGTRFTTEAVEGRIAFAHEEVGGIAGTFGLQLSQREFAAIGEEAFVEPVDTDTVGVFYVGQTSLGQFDLEGGVRFEKVEHDPTANRSRSFNLGAVSLGLIRRFGENWKVSAQLDQSSRAPVAEELYSDGAHLATNSYEIGDPSLDEEEATNISATLQYANENVSFMLSAYRTDFSDFIFEGATGAEIDELPVLQWQQEDAEFTGFEADVQWRAFTWDGGSLSFNAGFDVVDVDLSGPEEHLPRIPPQRWRLGTVAQWGQFVAEIGYTDVDDQDDVAAGELPTDGYDNLRAYLGYRARMGDASVEFFVRGDNLTDEEQRYHTSFIKDFAPQPGRTIEGGVTINI